MKKILGKKLSLLLLPLCLVLASCGSENDDDDNDDVVQEQTPVPTNNDPAPTNVSFTRHCRPVEEIQGGNFEYIWAMPDTGEIERLSFDTGRNQARVQIAGVPGSQQGPYTPVPAPEGQAGSFGEFRNGRLTLSFPVIPTGTIRGSTKEYVIGNLSAADADLGTFLCPLSILRELNADPITIE